MVIEESAISEIREQNHDHDDQRVERESSPGGAAPPRGDHRDFLRDPHHVGLGMLNVADEARGDILGVEAEERGIAAEKRHKVEPVGNEAVAVGLDHLDVMGGKMSLDHDLLAGESLAFAGLGYDLAEGNFGFGGGSSRIGIGGFVFGFFVSHL